MVTVLQTLVAGGVEVLRAHHHFGACLRADMDWACIPLGKGPEE